MGNTKLHIDILKELFIRAAPKISKPADINKKKPFYLPLAVLLSLCFLFSLVNVIFCISYVQGKENSYSFVKEWGTLGTGNNNDYQFNRPSGLAIDPSTNHLYVVDSGNNRIVVFDSNGKSLN